jgi:uncharacterized protein YcfJ
MHARLKAAMALTTLTLAAGAGAQVTLYEAPDFQGRNLTATRPVADFGRSGFNDRASSAMVLGGAWEACENANFGGDCRVLRPGRYPTLQAMGLNDRISSLRPLARNARVGDDRYAPAAEPAYDNRRRANERLYEAQVTAVREVVGTPGQRCWIEREQVGAGPHDNRVAGGILGAVIGGVLGHQIGAGSGRDLATVGGVVAGAAVGANLGRGEAQSAPSRDVQRCSGNAADARPGYWDVSYRFRGRDHQVQMTTAPGRTITVNRRGEPRA